GGVGVPGDVPVGRLGLPDPGPGLVLGGLHGVDPVRRRGDPAGEHDLQVVGAGAQLLAGGPAELDRAVAHGTGAGTAGVRAAVPAGPPEVAVPAGLGEGLAAEHQPGPVDQALLHRLGQPPVAPADVADRGEAAAAHVA